MKIHDVLDRDEIRALTRTSDLRGWFSVCVSWGVIGGSLAVVGRWPTAGTIVLALILLGGRQLALAILMHECAHRSLFRTRRLNDLVGEWLCAAPTWNHLASYRRHHLAHHAHTGTERDTDIGLVAEFPISRASLLRKVFRDLSGIAGVRRVAALLAMDVGVLEYTASVGARRTDPKGRNLGHLLRTGLGNLGPVVLTNTALWGVLAWAGQGWTYALWVAAYLTTYGLFLRIRSMAEHACVGEALDPFRNTRTTLAPWWARLTVAPHHVNYHLEHHLLMTVPHYRLPRMHRLLRDRGAIPSESLAPGYLHVLRTITR